jgi:hypothetical protein
VDVSTLFPLDALLYYVDNPVAFIEDIFQVTLEPWQRQVCEKLAHPDHGFVAVAAGSGVGKTWLLSKVVFWFLTTRRGVVPCTAPTQHQLHDILWKELRKDLDRSPILQKIFTWTKTKLFVNGHVATWYAVAQTATDNADGVVQEGLSGFHDENMLCLLDEASGIASAAFAAMDGALTAPNAKIIMTSNPTRLSGRFYNAFTKSCRAKGGPWDIFNISCYGSQYVGDKYISNAIHEHGEDSPFFKSKVLGQFPDEEDMALIGRSFLEAAMTGNIPARVYTREDVPSLPPQRPVEYRNSVYATEDHQRASHSFWAKVGMRGLIGQRPGGGFRVR